MLHTSTVRTARTILAIVAILTLGATLGVARAAGNPVRLTIEPQSQLLQAGQRVTYTVNGVDADGTSRDVTAFVQVTTDDPYGSVKGATYTAGKVGTWTVTAILNDLTVGTAVRVVAGSATTIAINPDSAPELLSPGQERRFSILAYDSANNRVDAPAVIWSVEKNIGVVDADGSFTATDIGVGKLTATGPNDLKDVILIKVRGEVLTNTSGDTTSDAVGSTNASDTNTSGSIGNTNTADQTNGDQETLLVASTDESASTAACTSYSTSAWVGLLILYTLIVTGLYVWLRASSTDWWWVAPAIVTAAALWVFAARRCGDQYAWWPYTILGIGVVLSALYLWLRPRREQLGINL